MVDYAIIGGSKREYFMRRLGALKSERESFIPHWREAAEFIQPRRGRFFTQDRNRGDRRYQSIINSRATQALRIARSGLLAGTMSPARPWFALGTTDPDLMEFAPVKIWLYKAEVLLRRIFNSGNLYNMAPAMLGELLNFGTGAMIHLDDFEDVSRFYTFTVGSYSIAQDDKQRVNTLVREYEMTVEQMAGAFGLENLSQSARMAYDRGDYDSWYPVVHYIGLNPDFDPRRPLAKNKRFSSCYFEPGKHENRDQDFLRESGYDDFPAYCPRWDTTAEDIYGTDCPAMTALGDIKGLQIEERRKAQAIDKMVNPPLKGPSSLRNVPVSSLPGGLTIYDEDSSGKNGLSTLYEVRMPLNELRADIKEVEQRINDAFFVQLFKPITMMEGIQPKNQFELMQRNQEALLELGPVLERIHGEFLSRLIDRQLKQMFKADLLPPAPEEMQGQEIRVEYISSLAMAQRAVATGGIDRLAAFVGGLVGAGFQSAADKFDADQAIDEYSSLIGVPPRLVVPDEQVAAIREQRAQQQQQMQMMEMAKQAAETAKSASDAQMTEPSALSMISDAVGKANGSQ